MNERTQDRLFAGAGIASVAAMLAGVAIGAAGGREFATITSSPSQITHALSKSAGAAVWIGAYLELLSFGCFIAFAVWACAKLGGGLLGAIARACAVSYATVSVVALAFGDAIEYRAGHGMGIQLGSALVTINEAIFVGTWFLASFFLLAAGPLALSAGRRALGWSAIGIAALILVLTAVSLDNLGQLSNFLWLGWTIAASVALVRGERAPSGSLLAAGRA
jgi:hypothetical protein